MPLAKINGIDLYYETHGQGPAIAFAHGGAGSHLSWWQQVPALSGNYQCVTFDHRGFGVSHEIADGPGAGSYVEDLRALLDQLGIEKAAVVGQSMGGWTVLGFAATYPHRTRALVLCDTTAGMDDPEVSAEQKLIAGRASGGLIPNAVAADFPRREPALHFLYSEINQMNNLPPKLLAGLFGLRFSPDPLVEHRIPTLLVWGDQDALIPPSTMELMKRRIPHARTALIRGAGHSVYFEKGAEFNSILLEFLQTQAV
jgi:pimeloyl-ACP methyl ester carboxylesterase